MVPKIIIHAWKLLWNRITTTLKLLKRGCVPPNVSTNCIFCDSEVESIRYVFFECICIPCLDGGSTILNEKLSINSTFKLFLKFLLIPQILILLLFNLCVLPPIKKKNWTEGVLVCSQMYPQFFFYTLSFVKYKNFYKLSSREFFFKVLLFSM